MNLENMPGPRWGKVPTWARDEFRRVLTYARSLEAKLAEGPESNTWADPHGIARPLGVDPTVYHGPPFRDGLRAGLDLRFRAGELSVSARCGGLHVRPQSANTIVVVGQVWL